MNTFTEHLEMAQERLKAAEAELQAAKDEVNARIIELKSDSYDLTYREKEVLALVREGKSNKEIGWALHISTRTASFHVSSMLAKCGVQSRREL